MKTSIKAQVVIETDRFNGFASIDKPTDKEEITLTKIRDEISKGHYTLEWVNSDLDNYICPVLIIKL